MDAEKLQTLFHIRGTQAVCWDALGVAVLAQLELGPVEGGQGMAIAVSIDPAAAQSLAAALLQVLADTPHAGAPMQ